MSTQDPYGSSDPGSRGPGDQPSWPSSSSPGRTGSSPAGAERGGYPAHPGHAPPGGGYGGYDRPAPRNGLGVAALVLGILALLFFWTVLAGLLGLLAVILGVIGVRRAKHGEATNRGVAITGVVLGVLSTLLAVAALVGYLALGSQFIDCYRLGAQGASEQQVQQCVSDQVGVPVDSVD